MREFSDGENHLAAWNRGANHTFVVRVTSLSGYTGTVTVTPGPVADSNGAAAPSITSGAVNATVAANQSADATITCFVPSTVVPPRSFMTYPSYTVAVVNSTDGTHTHGLTGVGNVPLVLTPIPWTLPTVPAMQLPASVTAGTAQGFTMTANWKPSGVDGLGYPTVGGEVWMRFQDPALGPDAAAGSCTVLSVSSGAVFLNADDGSFQAGTYANSSGVTKSNSQCSADFGHATGVFSVANVTWTSMTPLTFSAAWKGKTVHVYVHSRNDNLDYSGWRDWGPVVIQ